MRFTLRFLNVPALLIGRLAGFVLRRLLGRGGSAVPGRLANALAPGMLARVLGSFDSGLVIVTGSAGKSTTTKMLTAILRAHGLRVFTNSSTANLAQGVASAIIDQSSLFGRIDADIGVVELDEAVAARLAPQLSPGVVVLTNVMRDQLDRFQSPQRVAGFLEAIAARATSVVVGNRDDGFIVELSRDIGAPTRWFGAGSSIEVTGLGYAKTDARPSAFGTTLAALDGRDAVIRSGRRQLRITLPSRGAHYGLDAAAAIEAAATVLGSRLEAPLVIEAFATLAPVFGRGEVVRIGGEDVELVLVQNPSSFQLNIDLLNPRPEQLLVAVGSDVRDASWLWSVDTAGLGHVDVVTGSNAHEAALRLAYDNVEIGSVSTDLGSALTAFLALPRPRQGLKTIVFTADPMRRIRRQLGLDRAADAA